MIILYDWHAWYDLMPGHAPVLHVGAQCSGLSGGQSITLQREAPRSRAAPSIVGPSYRSREDAPPTFEVNLGDAPFYSVEIATRPELLAPGSRRSKAEFYGTWQSRAFHKDPVYTLDPEVWSRLKAAPRLYYRIVTSRSDARFVEPIPSVAAAAVESAPFIQLFDAEEIPAGTRCLVIERVVTGDPDPQGREAPPTKVAYREEATAERYDSVIILPMGIRLPVENVY